MRERHYKDLGLTVEIVTQIDRLAALGADYQQLYERAKVGLPFQLLDWHLAWWRAFATNSLLLRDRLLVHVVRSASEGCVGIVPLVLTQRPAAGPLRIGTLALIGTDQYITELRTPILLPGREHAVGTAVWRCLAKESRWDWAHWSGHAELERALSAGCPLQASEPSLDYVLDLAPSWDEFRAGLKRNIKESVRHCYNSLKRENLTLEFELVKSSAQIGAALDTFFHLHGARAGLGDTVEHPNRFESETARGFLRDVCQRLAARDIARVFLLKISGQVVAARVGFELNDSLYLYYSGFDPDWRKYSVMTTLVAEAIKYAIERGLKTVNLSAGTDVSKTRWGARAVPFAEAIQLRPRLRSQLASTIYHSARASDAQHAWVRGLLRVLPRRQWGAK